MAIYWKEIEGNLSRIAIPSEILTEESVDYAVRVNKTWQLTSKQERSVLNNKILIITLDKSFALEIIKEFLTDKKWQNFTLDEMRQLIDEALENLDV